MEILYVREPNNIKYISGGYFVSNGLWTHPKRVIDSYELMIVTKGIVHLFYDNKKHIIQNGEAFLIKPGVLHYGIGEALDVSFYWLHFTDQGEAFEEISNLSAIKNKINTVREGSFCIMIPDHFSPDRSKISVLIRQLLHCKEEQYYTARISDILMEMILIEITQNYMDLYQNKKEKMQAVCDWIRANRYLNISLQEVANQFGYNKEYLARAFKAETGITVKQYIIHLKLDLAKRKLLETKETVEQIASGIGMQDAKVFMKLFKREENLTPTQYRKTFHKIHFNSK